MYRVFRWTFYLTVTVLVGLVLALVGLYFFLSRSLPDYNKETPVVGLPSTIEIVRDTSNVPHVFGETDAETFFGLGYAHAQDRLWQMTLLRRTAQGRLSELFGERTLQTDMLIRRLDLYTLSRQTVHNLSPRTQTMLQAYSAGVNARLSEINRESLGRGAPEFFLFSNAISPWQPADSVAILKLMGLQLSGHINEEVLRAKTSLRLGDDRIHDILPDTPGTGIVETAQFQDMFPNAELYATHMDDHFSRLLPVKPRGLSGASNAWAAMPSRNASNGTLLANDPHLGLTAPSVWYLARMELQSGGVIGGTIPGIPTVLVGRSAHLGWGLTTAYVDDQDLFVEKLNVDDRSQYLTPDGYKPFRKKQSIIQIADKLPVTLELLWTENGPVIPGNHYDLAAITPPDHVMSLSWTLLSDSDKSIEAAIELMQMKSVQTALEVSKKYVAPAQNLTLADRGNIAMRTIGAIPKRSVRHQSKGRIPAPGWVSENRWQGILPQTDNPIFFNPDSGILGNTNNKIVDRQFPKHVSFEWGDTQRIQRWKLLMEEREIHTRDSFISGQLDTVSPTARSLLALIGADLWFQTQAAEPGTFEGRRQTALNLLANWNGQMNEHLPEPLIYAAWVRALQKRLIQDELGPLADEFKHIEPLFIERVYRDVDGAAQWCDVVQSAPVETCSEISKVALDDALIWLREKYGGSVESLRWGDAHEARHDHAVLGNTPILKWFVNIRQSTSGGDNTLLRGRTLGEGPDPFLNVHAGAYRGVYDFADPDSSVFVISTGQSGHPLSRFYDNLSHLWRRGEFIPMSLNEDLARAGAVGVTRLVPAAPQTTGQ